MKIYFLHNKNLDEIFLFIHSCKFILKNFLFASFPVTILLEKSSGRYNIRSQLETDLKVLQNIKIGYLSFCGAKIAENREIVKADILRNRDTVAENEEKNLTKIQFSASKKFRSVLYCEPCCHDRTLDRCFESSNSL